MDDDDWSDYGSDDDSSEDGPRAPPRQPRIPLPLHEGPMLENAGNNGRRPQGARRNLEFNNFGNAGNVGNLICAQCDQQKPAMFTCGHCSQVIYCGQKCADAHWTTHMQSE